MTRSRSGRRRPAVHWTARALDDLEEIGDLIAADSPVAAARWIEKLVAAAERAGEAPMAGRRVPEIARDDIREIVMRGYRIVYRVGAERVDVLTVFEGHRRLPVGALDD